MECELETGNLMYLAEKGSPLHTAMEVDLYLQHIFRGSVVVQRSRVSR